MDKILKLSVSVFAILFFFIGLPLKASDQNSSSLNSQVRSGVVELSDELSVKLRTSDGNWEIYRVDTIIFATNNCEAILQSHINQLIVLTDGKLLFKFCGAYGHQTLPIKKSGLSFDSQATAFKSHLLSEISRREMQIEQENLKTFLPDGRRGLRGSWTQDPIGEELSQLGVSRREIANMFSTMSHDEIQEIIAALKSNP